MAHRFRQFSGGLQAAALLGVVLLPVPAAGQRPDTARVMSSSAMSAAPRGNSFSASGRNAAPAVRPDPTLSPGQVIDIMLGALRNNDWPTKDHGIAVTFEFASPANRDATGPLQRFAWLVKNPSYRAMLNHQRSERGDLHVMRDQARQRVTLVGDNGERVTYLFMLSRQTDGPYKGCWMTDGVVRETELGATRYERLTLFDIAPPQTAMAPADERG